MEYINLDVWKHSRDLVKVVYQVSSTFPKSEAYGLSNQMRRSAISIPSNIAEACGRSHEKETIQFLYELETQVYLAFDLTYLDKEQKNQLINRTTTCKKLLNGFIKYYRSHQPTTIN